MIKVNKMSNDDELMAAIKDLRKQPLAQKTKAKAKTEPGRQELTSGPPPPGSPAKGIFPNPYGRKGDPNLPKKDKALKPETIEKEGRQLRELQSLLSQLSKKALKRLTALLDCESDRVKMQAALGTIRATVQALTRDTSTPGGGAEIHIHCSSQAAVVNPPSPGKAAQPPNPHDGMQRPKGVGHPIAIVK
jgi:hypothetical protein